jgi:hypothetical protein
MSRRTRAGASAIALLVLGWAAAAQATVMVELSLEEMVARADGIVIATVERSGSQLVLGESAEPHTVTTLRVSEWLKGAGGERIVLRERGGVVQDRGMWIDGTPRYARGERVLVFLERRPDQPGQFRTFAMAQGKFRIVSGIGGAPDTVVRDLDGVGFARWADGVMTVSHANDGPAAELALVVERIVDVLAAGAVR